MVFGVLFFFIVAAGGVILMPMRSIILSRKSDLNSELATYAKKDAKLAESVASLEIKKLNDRLNFVEKMSKTKGLNSIFKDIIDKKNQGIKITFFSYEKGKELAGDNAVHLSGRAETRDELFLFEGRLKKEFGYGNVVSPVSNLINEKDFDFSLILTIKNEK